MKRRKKIKIFSLALCAVMLLSLPSAVYASPPGEEAYISQGEIALHAYADETGGAVRKTRCRRHSLSRSSSRRLLTY